MDGSEAGQSDDPPQPALRLATTGPVRWIVTFVLIWAGTLAASRVWAQAEPLAHPAAPSVSTLVAMISIMLMASACISGSETALFSLGRLDLLHLRKSGGSGARAAASLLDSPHDTLTTILVLNSLINIAVSFAMGTLTELMFSGAKAIGFALAAFGATTLVVVFGEAIPKCVALSQPQYFSRLLSPPIYIASKAIFPLRWVINALLAPIYRRLRIVGEDVEAEVSEEELKAVINAGEMSMALEKEEREMIHGVFELRHTFADEIMTPRTDVIAFPDTLDQREMLDKLRETPHSRALIYHENLDDIVGFLLAKEALLHPDTPWRDFIRAAPILPMRIRLLELLKAFRRHMTKIAVLVDEFGGCAGIVTLHDLMEEIVGDMAERHDTDRGELALVEPGLWIVNGRMHIEDLGDEIGTRFPEDLGSTIGGFVMNTLGRVPGAGEEVRHDGFVIRVTRMLGRRVMELQIQREIALVENGESKEAAS